MENQKMPEYETIRAAVAGEKWAVEKVVECYKDEIDRLSTVAVRQPDGSTKQEINEDMRQSIRKMALDGYCLNLDLPQLRRMSYLLQNCSNNLNQVAKRVNESNQLYAADIEDLRHRLDELIGIGKQILSKLSEL